MFAISFDMKVDSLRQHYGDPYNPAYYEIKNLMRKHGFSWVQGSVYIAFEGDMTNLYSAIEALKGIEWFRLSVRDIRAFRVEDWSNFTPVVAIPQ